jgi:predicted nucleic-acid-binding protein
VTGDDPAQTARARAAIDRHDVLVLTTVLLETEWVLRTLYGFEPAQLAGALEKFAGLPRVRLEHPEHVARALAWFRAGMDFADALHLAGADSCEAFLTFDGDFIKSARAVGAAGVRLP